MKRREHRVRLRGRWWVIRDAALGEGDCGYCHWESQRILIRSDVKGLERLDTLIHEMLHATLPDTSEDAVERAATDIAAALAKIYGTDLKGG